MEGRDASFGIQLLGNSFEIKSIFHIIDYRRLLVTAKAQSFYALRESGFFYKTIEHSGLMDAKCSSEETQFILAVSFSVFGMLTAIHITRALTLESLMNAQYLWEPYLANS